MIGNKIAEKIIRAKPVPETNSRNVCEIVIPSYPRQGILNKLRQVLLNGKLQNI